MRRLVKRTLFLGIVIDKGGKDSQGNGFGKDFPDPYGTACARFGFIEKHGRKYQGVQDLRLMLCRASAPGIKTGDVCIPEEG